MHRGKRAPGWPEPLPDAQHRNQCGGEGQAKGLGVRNQEPTPPKPVPSFPLVTWRDVAGSQSRVWPLEALWKERHTP